MLITLATLVAVAAAPLLAQDSVPRSGKAPVDALTARDSLPLDPAVRTGTLPNGLTYYIRRNDRPKERVELRLVVDAGSVLENERQLGLAHFVEHMAFNGTRRFEKQALVDFLERSGSRFGAHVNAYTSFDETVFMLRVPTDRPAVVDTALMILEDWAGAIAFDSAEVERERGVVVEEWRLGQGAGERVRQEQFPVLFAGSRYATRLPIGTRESLESFRHADLVEFYRDWYRPDLMAIVVVGDIDPAAMEGRIRSAFGDLRNPAGAPERVVHPVPVGDSTKVLVSTDPELTTSDISVYHPLPLGASGTVAAYRRKLIETLYNSMLNQRFAEMTQKPDAPFVGAYSSKGRFVRSNELYALGALAKEGEVEEALEALLVEAARVDAHGFTSTELERVKAEILRAYEQAYAERANQESPSLAAEYVAHFLYDEPSPGIAVEYDLVRAMLPTITLDDVNTLGRDWISDRGRIVLASVPEKAGIAPPTAASLRAAITRATGTQVAAYEDDVTDAPLIATLPAPGRITSTTRDTLLGTITWTLSNGARVVVKPTDFKDDEVVVSAFSPGGHSIASDADALAAALAPFAATAGGVGEFDAIALQKRLAGKAASVTPYVAETTEGIVGGASPRDLETFFQLAHLYITAPRRDSVAYEALQQNLRTVFENRALSPGTAFNDTLAVLLAQHHPRRMPITAARLDSVSIGEAYGAYRERFRNAGDLTMVIVGAVDPDSLRPLVERYIGSLPAPAQAERARDLGVRPPTGRIERTVSRGIEPQSTTALVFTSAFDYTPQNRVALGAVAEVLTIRLRERLREALGATYGVSVGASASKVPVEASSLSINFGSAPGRADELVAGVMAELDSLRANGPSADVLAKVKATMLRERETNVRVNSYWLERISGALELGEDPRLLLGAEDRIRALTPEQVRDAARKWVLPERYVRVTLVPEQ